MTATLTLRDVTALTVQKAMEDAFPFPLGSLLCGHKIMRERPDGFEVLLFACSRSHVNASTDQGLAFVKSENLLWLSPPPPKIVSRRTVVMGCLFGAVFFVVLQSVGAQANRRLETLRSQIKKSDAQTSLSTLATSVPTFLPKLFGQIPPAVEVVDIDVDFSKRSLVMKARAPHYGGVSDTVGAMAKVQALSRVRAGQSRLSQLGERSVIDFTMEAALQ